MQTKPQLAIAQLTRLTRSGLPIGWVAFDEVYGRSSKLRRTCEEQGLAYVAIIHPRFPDHDWGRDRDPGVRGRDRRRVRMHDHEYIVRIASIVDGTAPPGSGGTSSAMPYSSGVATDG
jgi:SRSO17 transposase